MSIAIYFGSTTGNTEYVAELIQQQFARDSARPLVTKHENTPQPANAAAHQRGRALPGHLRTSARRSRARTAQSETIQHPADLAQGCLAVRPAIAPATTLGTATRLGSRMRRLASPSKRIDLRSLSPMPSPPKDHRQTVAGIGARRPDQLALNQCPRSRCFGHSR